MTHTCVVVGTDTEIGKTQVCLALLNTARALGLTTLAMKPIASGFDDEGNNDDLCRLALASSLEAPRHLVNPYAFKPAIAPHLAASEAGESIRFQVIDQALQALLALQPDVLLVEGVGGVLLPLGPDGGGGEWLQHLGLPVLLVVGMRLGCLNHALLSAEALLRRNIRLVGWVANCLTPAMPRLDGNIGTLNRELARSGVAALATLAFGATAFNETVFGDLQKRLNAPHAP